MLSLLLPGFRLIPATHFSNCPNFEKDVIIEGKTHKILRIFNTHYLKKF
jgi:hypothetical protein